MKAHLCDWPKLCVARWCGTALQQMLTQVKLSHWITWLCFFNAVLIPVWTFGCKICNGPTCRVKGKIKQINIRQIMCPILRPQYKKPKGCHVLCSGVTGFEWGWGIGYDGLKRSVLTWTVTSLTVCSQEMVIPLCGKGLTTHADVATFLSCTS